MPSMLDENERGIVYYILNVIKDMFFFLDGFTYDMYVLDILIYELYVR